jgi:hypothetical protein
MKKLKKVVKLALKAAFHLKPGTGMFHLLLILYCCNKIPGYELSKHGFNVFFSISILQVCHLQACTVGENENKF